MNKIQHYPKGLSPYKDLGHQRIPYLPEANQNVQVGAIVEGNVDNVHLILNRNYDSFIKPSETKVNADNTYVKFDIGSFNANDKVTYQIFSDEDKSAEYNFNVGKWVTPLNATCTFEKECIRISDVAFINDIFIYNINNKILISDKNLKSDVMQFDGEKYCFSDGVSLKVSEKPFKIDVFAKSEKIISDLNFKCFYTDKLEKVKVNYKSQNQGIFGLGEKFNGVNQLNEEPKNVVFEKFTQQEEITYFPVPFFYSTSKHGIFIDTSCNVNYSFSEDEISFEMDLMDDIYIMTGEINNAIKEYTQLTGDCKLPPKWAFGPWISANRWNSQKHIDEQIEFINKYKYPTNALVIEAWSDEATFYIFNEGKYEPKKGNFTAEEIAYDKNGLWTNPQKMINELNDLGIKLILWQAPVIKKLEEDRENKQHEIDCQEVVEKDLVLKNADGTPYEIPQSYWFEGSYVPDFTKKEACEWVANKRKYLSDMGVDGFKTDGGEFIYYDEIIADNNMTGKELRNEYPYYYEKAYVEMLNENQVLFSRAGYKGAQKFPIHWAGDQQSLFSEFRDMLKGGLSLGLSGVPFWSFDIGGFAGQMPTTELYLRWTAMAVFAPVYQWHSEPTFGQFADVIKGSGGINDRSPWNIAKYNKDEKIIDVSCYYANMRMNLLPYIYQVAKDCAKESKPMMRHLYYDNANDEKTLNIEDEFMLGDLLVAPIVHEGETTREIYLPQGQWENIFTGEDFNGKMIISQKADIDKISVFIKMGTGVMLNLDNEFKFGGWVSNDVDTFVKPCVYISGDEGKYSFADENITCDVTWSKSGVTVNSAKNKNIYIISKKEIENMQLVCETHFQKNHLFVYQ